MRDRLSYLDSTRGIAALTVFLSHFLGAFVSDAGMQFWNNSVLHSLSHGEGAVSYFFILSGFVLSYTYFRNETNFEKSSYVSFVFKRIFKIYPVFIMVLLLRWIIKRYFYHAEALLFIIALMLYTAKFLMPTPVFISIYVTKLNVGTILALVLCSKSLQYILSLKAFISFGHISYCFYLCHFIAILWISPKLFILFNDISNKSHIVGIILILTAGSSVLLSYVLRSLGEEPALVASRAVLQRFKL